MSVAESTAQPSFVVLQIGKRHFALPSETVVELAPPVRLHRFPHTSPLLSGVIVRRSRIVPVYDAASVLIGSTPLTQRFYLIARRGAGRSTEFAAIPVNGECELASGEVRSPEEGRPSYVAGTLSFNDEAVEILDFDALAALNAPAPPKAERPQ
ncbi:MAG TPA: chemotaxis protein CheW [Verrucomicrobiae bacterium]|nr:chemotaxis protein CheW [Verrucomicrobiae bacterium]